MITWFLLSAAFGLGWILRGTLCLRDGGCDVAATDEIARLMLRNRELEAQAWAREQGLTR